MPWGRKKLIQEVTEPGNFHWEALAPRFGVLVMGLEIEAVRGTGSELAGGRARCLTQPYAGCLQVTQEAGDSLGPTA